MDREMKEMKVEVGKLREVIFSQEEELVRMKGVSGTQDVDALTMKLQDMEEEMEEQKRSNNKITKLCLAAIKSLERLESRPPGSFDYNEGDPEREGSREGSVGLGVDPALVKVLCDQMGAINKVLGKVDDDIEGIDVKTEENKGEIEQLGRQIKEVASQLREGEKKRESLIGEVKAMVHSQTFATREDLARGTAAIREEARQGLERSSANFLRTIHSETGKLGDLEELIKKEVGNLGSRIEEEKARTGGLVTALEEKISSLKRDLDQEKSRGEEYRVALEKERDKSKEQKTTLDLLSKEEPGKVNARIERLGKEVSLLKTKHTEVANMQEKMHATQETIDNKVTDISKELEIEKRKMENQKMLIENLSTGQEKERRKGEELKVLVDGLRMSGQDSEQAKTNTRFERLGKELALLKSKHTDLNQVVEEINSKQKDNDCHFEDAQSSLDREEIELVGRKVKDLAMKNIEWH